MDCREALQILEFSDLEPDVCPAAADSSGGEANAPASEAAADTPGSSTVQPDGVWSADERAAARAHLAGCPVCERAMRQREELDRAIGQVMQNVPVPRVAQQRLMAQLAELEAAGAASGTDVLTSAGDSAGSEVKLAPAEAAPAQPVRPTRRRFLKSLVPLSALVAALAGFFGVVWVFQPRYAVSDVSSALVDLDFQALNKLSDFPGKDAASRLASEPGWDHLQWQCGGRAKGLPLAVNVIAVYGFELRTRQPGEVLGLIAVIPRNRVHNPPTADSLATALSDYVTARIGESVSVSWRQGDYVCVCLVSGPDALSRLQAALEQPAA